MRNLNVHTALQHKEGVESLSTSNMNVQPPNSPQINSIDDTIEESLGDDPSYIRQLDGNDTLDSFRTDVSDSVQIVSEEDNSVSVPGPHDLRYNYAINPQNQSRRLISSALKSPLTVTYNHFEVIDNITYAFNVNVECNSGVYLTAIKPVLQTVSTDWNTKIGSWSVTCCKVSSRQDSPGDHLLCTVLTLNITNTVLDSVLGGPSQPHKVTLHCYHTKNKIQVQSSAILTPGTAAASWIVENLIEPLARNHIASNSQSIQQVNNAILSSISPSTLLCNHCNFDIDPGANQVRDQPLTCKKCLKMFHKKCSDRRGTKGCNWNKNPWFCSICLTGNIPTIGPSVSHPHGSQQLITVVPPPSSQSNLSQLIPMTVTDPPTTTLDLVPEEVIEAAVDNAQQNEIDHGTVRSMPSNSNYVASIPQGQGSHSNTDQASRYPSNAIRQRKSNIATIEPEKEFQKAVIDACRSTITQQEAELKRLNESLDIRNKKIMQLESQVGTATSYLSSRDTGHQCSSSANISDQFTALLTTMNLLLSKLSLCTDSPAASRLSPVNIFNSPCQGPRSSLVDRTVQTDTNDISSKDIAMTTPTNENISDDTETVLTCTICGKILETSAQLDLHIESDHSSVSGITDKIICDYCDETFMTSRLLQQHQSSKHATSYIKCGSCMQRFQNRSQLEIHMKASHITVTASIPTSPTSSGHLTPSSSSTTASNQENL